MPGRKMARSDGGHPRLHARQVMTLFKVVSIRLGVTGCSIVGFACTKSPRSEIGQSAVPLHLLQWAILLVCICWPASKPALAESGACPPTASDEIPAAPPERVGMRSGQLANAIKSLRDKDRDIHALVVLRNCNLVVELYAENVTRHHNHALYSITKSVLATL